MTDTAIHPVPKQGRLRRTLGTVRTWLQGLDYTGVDYALDHIEFLEQELGRLEEELRQSRETTSIDAHRSGVNL